MITGQVNSTLEGIISLPIHGTQEGTRVIEAIIDTGFAGYLTLTPAIINALGLSKFAIGQLTLADGSEIVSDLFQATVVWDGQDRTIEVDTLETEALAGMALLEGFDLNMRIVRGGHVTIKSVLPAQPGTT